MLRTNADTVDLVYFNIIRDSALIRFVNIFSDVVLCPKHAIYAVLIISVQNTGYCWRYFADKSSGTHFINMYTICKYETLSTLSDI